MSYWSDHFDSLKERIEQGKIIPLYLSQPEAQVVRVVLEKAARQTEGKDAKRLLEWVYKRLSQQMVFAESEQDVEK